MPLLVVKKMKIFSNTEFGGGALSLFSFCFDFCVITALQDETVSFTFHCKKWRFS